jgi:hypothetical protein
VDRLLFTFPDGPSLPTLAPKVHLLLPFVVYIDFILSLCPSSPLSLPLFLPMPLPFFTVALVSLSR